ncbi:formimidoylglutamase [Ferrimonas senticii]|uniref:formimidoylglutamase n=1 Tax=Ferrimonas senticii TaxID=394566 RepID=UPI0004114862|nr:formimidoylglutamase [Ferrimonas senticii]
MTITPVPLQPEQPLEYVRPRHGEQRIGERLAHYDGSVPLSQQLSRWAKAGKRYVLLGVPEDLGPRANLGNGGADGAWSALLTRLLNLQWHDHLPTQSLALLGRVTVSDLQTQAQDLDLSKPEQLARLRWLVSQLDLRVASVLEPIFAAGLIPIVIGGGHNNALPIIRAYAQVKRRPAQVINLDPHADCRALEGRHSGNPFSYALDEGSLSHYAVVGLNPYKNSAATLAQLQRFGGLGLARTVFSDSGLSADIEQALKQLPDDSAAQPLGIELDLDSIALMPSSAQSPWGVSLYQAQSYIQQLQAARPMAWLHLAEGAPSCHPSGLLAGNMVVGEALTALVLAALAD